MKVQEGCREDAGRMQERRKMQEGRKDAGRKQGRKNQK